MMLNRRAYRSSVKAGLRKECVCGGSDGIVEGRNRWQRNRNRCHRPSWDYCGLLGLRRRYRRCSRVNWSFIDKPTADY